MKCAPWPASGGSRWCSRGSTQSRIPWLEWCSGNSGIAKSDQSEGDMVLVKLTGPGGVQRRVHWVVGEMVEIPVTERGTTLCAPGLLHTYEGETVEEALALGMLMNPIHTVIASPEAYEVEGDVVSRDATRAGAHRLLVLRRLDVPTVTIDQCVEIAIRCALVVCNEPSWVLWAEKWLNGEDRTVELARAAQKSAAAARAAELADEAWAAVPIGRIAASVIYGGVK